MMNLQETAAHAAFLELGLSKSSLKKLLQRFGSALLAWQSLPSDVLQVVDEKDRANIQEKDEMIFFKHLKKCETESIHSVNLQDADYPILLKEINSPPFVLFIRGDRHLLSALHPIAVVGTRKISAYGKQVLYELIPALVRAGATIVSGLAYGVDSLAHEIALEHGGKCVAVLGSGVDVIYPAAHRNLAAKIIESGGTIISELPLGMQPLPQFFPARNRILSGLSKATLVIEAQEQSGSLITAQFALDQNRDVYAVPGSIFSEGQRGTNQLISQGATPILSAPSLLQQLHLSSGKTSEVVQQLQFDVPEEKILYEHLREPRSLDELAQSSSLQISQISQLLSMMELKGMVRGLGQRYVRV
ncbi:MAG: DNA-processing protein DprA [Candidatus Altimarinota bacterium]